MAAPVPTEAMVMQKSFNRPRIVEALEMFGVRADARKGARALQAQLLQLIRDQAPCRVGGDGMLVDPSNSPEKTKQPRNSRGTSTLGKGTAQKPVRRKQGKA
jgi:hypothetical protein